MPPKCRHCHPFAMVETYASRLMTDGKTLVDMVATLEERIIPCATAMCPKCEHVSILSAGDVGSVVNTIIMWKRLAQWIDHLKEEEE